MQTCFRDALAVLTAAWTLAACHTASQQAAALAPESEQVIGEGLKDLYMQVSTAPPRSQEQQKLILRMANKASNGRELLLVMRAADGVFLSDTALAPNTFENQIRSTVTAKMMQMATLDQLIDYAVAYPVDSQHAHALAERIFELGNDAADSRVWYRIRAAAYHLGARDLGTQAQAKCDRLTRR